MKYFELMKNACDSVEMNFDEDKKFEIYFNEYMPKSKTEDSFHYEGVEEYLLVTSGSIILNLENKEYAVNEGEVIHFIVDKQHHYCNKTENISKAFILMFLIVLSVLKIRHRYTSF